MSHDYGGNGQMNDFVLFDFTDNERSLVLQICRPRWDHRSYKKIWRY